MKSCVLCLKPAPINHLKRCEHCNDILIEMARVRRVYGMDTVHALASMLGVNMAGATWHARPWPLDGAFVRVRTTYKNDILHAIREVQPNDRRPHVYRIPSDVIGSL